MGPAGVTVSPNVKVTSNFVIGMPKTFRNITWNLHCHIHCHIERVLYHTLTVLACSSSAYTLGYP